MGTRLDGVGHVADFSSFVGAVDFDTNCIKPVLQIVDSAPIYDRQSQAKKEEIGKAVLSRMTSHPAYGQDKVSELIARHLAIHPLPEGLKMSENMKAHALFKEIIRDARAEGLNTQDIEHPFDLIAVDWNNLHEQLLSIKDTRLWNFCHYLTGVLFNSKEINTLKQALDADKNSGQARMTRAWCLLNKRFLREIYQFPIHISRPGSSLPDEFVYIGASPFSKGLSLTLSVDRLSPGAFVAVQQRAISLSLSGNTQLQQLAPVITSSMIQKLNISNTGITNLPRELFTRNLRVLYINNLPLKTLPLVPDTDITLCIGNNPFIPPLADRIWEIALSERQSYVVNDRDGVHWYARDEFIAEWFITHREYGRATGQAVRKAQLDLMAKDATIRFDYQPTPSFPTEETPILAQPRTHLRRRMLSKCVSLFRFA